MIICIQRRKRYSSNIITTQYLPPPTPNRHGTFNYKNSGSLIQNPLKHQKIKQETFCETPLTISEKLPSQILDLALNKSLKHG